MVVANVREKEALPSTGVFELVPGDKGHDVLSVVSQDTLSRYHGAAGFECFSNMKGVLKRRLWRDPPLRSPPHTDAKLRWIDRLM